MSTEIPDGIANDAFSATWQAIKVLFGVIERSPFNPPITYICPIHSRLVRRNLTTNANGRHSRRSHRKKTTSAETHD
jgi:hypothetical protein